MDRRDLARRTWATARPRPPSLAARARTTGRTVYFDPVKEEVIEG